MIPLKLTLKGIYSYQQEQTIDFSMITDAHIFGIFGAVGSGKSAILEAMAFTLYGETVRLSRKENRHYNMMNLKSDEMYIEFIFRAGVENDEYKFTVRGKRNQRHFEKIEKFERNAYQKKSGEWLPINENSAEQVLGLSYDNFSRTIIIPQGKFHEFLHLSEAERSTMLKEIFHLEKFDLSNKVKTLQSLNQNHLQLILGRLTPLNEINDNSIREYQEHFSQLNAEKSVLLQTISDKTNALSAYSKLKELFERQAETERQYKKLCENQTEFDRREQKLKLYEICLLYFKDLLSQKKSKINQIERLSQELTEKKTRLTAVRLGMEQEKLRYEELEKPYRDLDIRRKQISELEEIILIKKNTAEAEHLSGCQVNYEQQITACEAKTQELKQKKELLIRQVKEKTAQLPDSAILTEIITWFTRKKAQEQMIAGLKNRRHLFTNEMKSLKQEVNLLVKDDPVHYSPDDLPAKPDFPLLFAFFNNEKMHTEKEQEAVNQQLQALKIQEKLEEFADKLSDGTPCPLCGSPNHPLPLTKKNVDTAIREQEKIKAELLKHNQRLNKILSGLTTYESRYLDKEKQQALLEQELNGEEEKLKALLTEFIWPQYSPDDEAKISRDQNLTKYLNYEINLINKDLEGIESGLAQTDQNYRKILADKEKNIRLLSAKQAEQITRLEKLEHLNINDFKHLPNEAIKTEIIKRKAELEKLIQDFLTTENSLKNANDQITRLTAEIESAEKNLILQQTMLNDDEAELEKRLKTYQFDSLEEIETLIKDEININQEKQEIENFRKQFHLIRENYRKLSAETAGQTYQSTEHISLQNDLDTRHEQLENLNQQIGGLSNKISQLEQNLALKNELIKEKNKLEEREADLTTLKSLFAGRSFVNYVSSIYLKNLCNSANERFYKLTRRQLKLELEEDNSFKVRDFLNNGRLRSIKTLSGGQTFQASLSLALALAENIRQEQETSHNFFFLDEGFGTLDKEALQQVFDTLKSLRQEGKVVGIISHLDELKQDIAVYLEVFRDEENGSTIKSSLE